MQLCRWHISGARILPGLAFLSVIAMYYAGLMLSPDV